MTPALNSSLSSVVDEIFDDLLQCIDERFHGAGPGDGLTGLPEPQEGPQTDFYNATADIVIYGGAAGGGKTAALFLEAGRHRDVPSFRATYFRRQQTQITKGGGPWDESLKWFPLWDAKPNLTEKKWKFPSGAEMQMASLQYDKDVLSFQSTQIALLLFDELTHFTEAQFFYMLSRNRSMSGVKKGAGYCRAATNPDGASWVKRLIAPWVDETWAAEDRAKPGEVRHIARKDDDGGQLIWVSDDWRYPPNKAGIRLPAHSITFIASKLEDNKKLLEKDPYYEVNLRMQNPVQAARLLHGDWSMLEGAFWAEWNEPEHTIEPPFQPGEQPKNWHYFAGLDWGYGSPFAFLLCAIDEDGRAHILDELHERQLTTREQSAKVCGMLTKWGLDRKAVTIAADPRMFHPAKRADLIGEADIEAFHRAGLRCVDANNQRQHGWNRVRDFLQTPDRFKVWKGFCKHLIEMFPVMQYAKPTPGSSQPNDMATDGDDHLHDCLRYALMTRPKPTKSEIAPAKPLTGEILERAGREALIIRMNARHGMVPKPTYEGVVLADGEYVDGAVVRDGDGNIVFVQGRTPRNMRRPYGQ